MGSDIVVVQPMIYEEMKSGDIVDKSKKDIEQLIYDFICSLGVAVVDSERS
jgi:aspartate/glutamate racemase